MSIDAEGKLTNLNLTEVEQQWQQQHGQGRKIQLSSCDQIVHYFKNLCYVILGLLRLSSTVDIAEKS